MGVSLRAYAKHRGVSDTAIRKAVKAGRIDLEPDGSVDINKADRQWLRNTDVSQQRTRAPAGQAPAGKDGAQEAHGTDATPSTYMQARTANEVLKAQTHRLKLQQLKQELVDRSSAMAHVFKLARSERDAWLNWPSRISAQMAACLEVDSHTLHVVLEEAVREHLQEMGEMQVGMG